MSTPIKGDPKIDKLTILRSQIACKEVEMLYDYIKDINFIRNLSKDTMDTVVWHCHEISARLTGIVLECNKAVEWREKQSEGGRIGAARKDAANNV